MSDRIGCDMTQVIAELLSGDEVETIKTMFMTMDTQKRGYLSFDEFMMGLRKFGSQLTEAEIQHLMEDVRSVLLLKSQSLMTIWL